MISEMDIKANLYEIAIDELKDFLTRDREENGQNPFTDYQILLFLTDNSKNIDYCVDEIYNAYLEHDKLDELVNPENELIREYLFNSDRFYVLSDIINNTTDDDDSDDDSYDE